MRQISSLAASDSGEEWRFSMSVAVAGETIAVDDALVALGLTAEDDRRQGEAQW